MIQIGSRTVHILISRSVVYFLVMFYNFTTTVSDLNIFFQAKFIWSSHPSDQSHPSKWVATHRLHIPGMGYQRPNEVIFSLKIIQNLYL